MFESRFPLQVSRGLRLVMFACALVGSGRVEAQTAAELAVRITALQDSIKVTRELSRAERRRRTPVLDDSVVAHGVSLFFPTRALSTDDRTALRQGIAAAHSTLTQRYGSDAARLLEGEVTSITAFQTMLGTEMLSFGDGRDPAGTSGAAFSPPLSRDEVRDYLLGRAGRRLMLRNSQLSAFAGVAFSLVPDDRAFYVARRQLVSSKSSVARRCAQGFLPACRTVLDIRHPDRRFGASDSIPSNGVPIPLGVHASVVSVAMELGGARAFQNIGQAEDLDEPLAILAQAAGVTPDSLLRAWSQRVTSAGGTDATPTIPFAAVAFGWCGIFMLVATRRRPR